MNSKQIKVDIEKSRFGEKGAIRNWVSKLSKGLMLPIALLPIAGLFLGIGAGWMNILVSMGITIDANPMMFLIPTILKTAGDVVFGSLPALFALAIAIAFTDDAGTAGLSALVAWLVFNIIQMIFITPTAFDPNGKIVTADILWYKDVTGSVVGSNLGITSMQTSVFGGIIVGLVVAGIYNRYKTTQLPSVVGFFSGTRLVLIMSFLSGIILGFMALLIWPQFGIWLDQLGNSLASMPLQTNTLIFGIVERSLIPFGLHHAFYAPLWFTSAGGQLLVESTPGIWSPVAAGDQNIWFAFTNLGIDFQLWRTAFDAGVISNLPGYSGNFTEFTSGGINYALTAGQVPGGYMQGKYSFMIFGLPAAAFAMIMLSKKENRQMAISIIGAAAFTAFLTGITEPLEFTFLFLAPFLYYGFHIWMAGLSFWFMALATATVGMTFSGGIIDLALYGILPSATGSETLWWWAAVIGAAMMPIYFGVFYWYIKRFDIATPGREEAGVVKMYKRADYAAEKVPSDLKNKTNREPRVKEFIKYLGGLENLIIIDACITRLRLEVKDPSKINDKALRDLGAMGVVHQGKSVQVILGAEADLLKHEIKAFKKEKALIASHSQ